MIPPGCWADLTQPKPNFFLTKLWPSFNIPTFAYTFRSYRYVEGWIAWSHVVTYNAWSRNLSFDVFDISVHPQVVWWELRTSKQNNSLLCMCTLSHLQFGVSTWSKGFVWPLFHWPPYNCHTAQESKGWTFRKLVTKPSSQVSTTDSRERSGSDSPRTYARVDM